MLIDSETSGPPNFCDLNTMQSLIMFPGAMPAVDNNFLSTARRCSLSAGLYYIANKETHEGKNGRRVNCTDCIIDSQDASFA